MRRLIRERLGRMTPVKLARFAATAALVTSVLLVALKLGAWFASGSISLLSSLLDSASDIIASGITFFAVRVAERPADADHRFGHGKAEALAALGTAVFVTGSALFLMLEAGQRLFAPAPVTHSGLGIAVMLVSILLTAGLIMVQRQAIAATGNLALKADSAHYAADFMVNGAVILSLVLTASTGLASLDTLFGLGVACYLLWAVLPVGRQAIDMLMDRELPMPERARLLDHVKALPGVVDAHDLRTRQSGARTFVELHVEMDGNIPLHEAHRIGLRVEMAVAALLPGADTLVHFDPAGLEERRRDDQIAAVEARATDIPP